MAVSKQDLQFLLTSSEPSVTQTVTSLSVGGYPSTTEVSPSALLTGAMDIVKTAVILDTTLGSPSNIAVADEIMQPDDSTLPYADAYTINATGYAFSGNQIILSKTTVDGVTGWVKGGSGCSITLDGSVWSMFLVHQGFFNSDEYQAPSTSAPPTDISQWTKVQNSVNGSLVSMTNSYSGYFPLSVVRAKYSTRPRFHVSGDVVYDLSNQNVFNSGLNDSHKQYRCIAVQNVHATASFYNLKFYLKQNSANAACTVKIAIEVPKYDITSGAASSGNTISLVDTTLRGYPEEEFIGRVLTITSGSNINLTRKIATFDTDTGTFTFLTAVPVAIVLGTTYRVENSPAQYTASGLISPSVGTDYVSDFSDEEISIDFGSTRTNGSTLRPNEVVYIWIERTLTANAEAFNNNRVIFTAQYTTS